MNVTVENLSACKKLIRVELDKNEVNEGFENVTLEFAKKASLPGFRAGKAPRDMIAKHFTKEIEDETRRKLISEGYHKAIKEKSLDVLGYPDIEDSPIGRDHSFSFSATIETSPTFDIPDYRGLPAKREKTKVTDEDVDKAIDALRTQKADFRPVDRPIQVEDIAVIHYKGTCDGKPLTDIAPVARGLTEKSNFWVAIKKDSFIPGFTEQLHGAKAGDKRTVEIDFPADFVSQPLAGKHASYEVEVVEVRERILPELTEEFAKEFGADNIEHLRRGVRQDLQNELNSRLRRSIRNQIVRALLDKVSFDLPESFVSQETRNVVYDIVHENQKRGVSKEAIDENKDDIYSAANQTAKERVKLGFLVQRIADQEGIRASESEVQTRIIALAQSYNMAPQKFLQELQKRNGLSEIYQQIIHDKVLDFLQENAHIEDIEPAPAPQA